MAIISDGTTIADAASFSVGLGNMVLLNTATASSSASLSFNNTYINSTYPIYKFEFINLHPQTNNVTLEFNVSTDNGSNYNVAKTTTHFRTYLKEDGTGAFLGYITGFDLAQGTGEQTLSGGVGNDNDQSLSAELTLFNPSSTTFIKHFIARTQFYEAADFSESNFTAGYANTASAVNAIRFKLSSGDIDSGQIKLYGIKGS